jgi:CheY-like chemotaxis protein
MIRHLFQLVLQKNGLAVTPACDGAEVLERWSEGGYDAILMDVEMPGMNGLAATRAIREQEPESRRIPIVGLTAHTAAEDHDRCLEAGMNECLVKPVDLNRLVETIRRWSTAP